MTNDGGFRKRKRRNLRDGMFAFTAPKWIKSWSKFANGRFNIAGSGRGVSDARTGKGGHVRFSSSSYRMQSGWALTDYCVSPVVEETCRDDTKGWRAELQQSCSEDALAELSSISRKARLKSLRIIWQIVWRSIVRIKINFDDDE